MIEVEPAGGTAPAASTAVARRHGDLDVLRYEAPISFTDRIRDYLRDAGRRVVRGRRLSLTRDRGLSLSVGLLEPFDEIMTHYAAGEDSDMGYRASRHGLLLTALEARLCHLGAGGGRLHPFVVAALGNLNPLVLHRIYSTDLKRSRRRSRNLLWRRFFILLFKDLARRKLSLPNARGILFAWRRLGCVFAQSEPDLRAWYPGFQKQLIERYSAPLT